MRAHFNVQPFPSHTSEDKLTPLQQLAGAQPAPDLRT